MSTYVLVHGAWGGSWCWKNIRPALQSLGHDVFTPTLTGVGERSHLLSPQVNLDTHIADVVNLIKWEGLSDVILCGHSYGGCVVSGVADQIPEKIGSLIYLDAFVPENGQSLHDLLPPEQRESQLQGVREVGEGWKVPPIPAEVFHVNPGHIALINRQATMHPLNCFTQAIKLTDGIERIKDITYVLATGFNPSPFPQFFEKARAKGWKTLSVPCGHMVMMDMPGELIQILLAAAPSREAAGA